MARKRKPKLLDLFCGAGGTGMGYSLAGFDVTGIDCNPQPRYPFSFICADALWFVERHGHKYDVIHASPPCQAYTSARHVHKKEHPSLIPATRMALEGTGKLWVIENVPGAPLVFPAIVCGLALNLRVKRHRLFESNIFLFSTTCPDGHRDPVITVTGHSGYGVNDRWVTVYGGGTPASADNRRRANSKQGAEAMGIDWMNRDELSQAIPPAYTKFIGDQLMAAWRNLQ